MAEGVNNLEYNKNINEVPGGRKKNKSNKILKMNRYTRLLNSNAILSCVHISGEKDGKTRKNCQGNKITYDDAETFLHHCLSKPKKVDQDKFILKFLKPAYPKRKSRNNNAKARGVSLNYTVRKKDGSVIPVCSTLFKNITGFSSHRLALIGKYFLHTGEPPEERRGGSRQTEKDKDITEAIKVNIKKYKCRESHYSRSKILRHYLPPELNLEKLWKMFCTERKHENLPLCSLSKYKRIFYSNFNIGFGNPHSDTCSQCKKFQLLLKTPQKNVDEKHEIKTLLRLHKLRAQKFHQIMKNVDPFVIKVVFDMQQNQPLPKLSIGEVFYSRQVWFYNLTILIHEKSQKHDDVKHYTWLETESGRGANQVASCVIDFLQKLDRSMLSEGGKTKYKLHLFSDSCASQNKNTVMMACLMRFLQTSSKFIEIKHFFPIRGHSFMPADRIFGRAEREFRKKEEIVHAGEYREILNVTGDVLCFGKDFNFYDYQKQSKEILKTRMPFKISETRVISYERAGKNVTVSSSTTYSGGLISCQVLKNSSASLKEISRAKILQKTNMVSEKKREDVKKLMEFFEIPECAIEFYNDVSDGNKTEKEENLSTDIIFYEEELI